MSKESDSKIGPVESSYNTPAMFVDRTKCEHFNLLKYVTNLLKVLLIAILTCLKVCKLDEFVFACRLPNTNNLVISPFHPLSLVQSHLPSYIIWENNICGEVYSAPAVCDDRTNSKVCTNNKQSIHHNQLSLPYCLTCHQLSQTASIHCMKPAAQWPSFFERSIVHLLYIGADRTYITLCKV